MSASEPENQKARESTFSTIYRSQNPELKTNNWFCPVEGHIQDPPE